MPRLLRHAAVGVHQGPEQDALASAVLTLVQRPPLRAQLSRTALASVRERTWEAALERLADGYRLALGEDSAAGRRVA